MNQLTLQEWQIEHLILNRIEKEIHKLMGITECGVLCVGKSIYLIFNKENSIWNLDLNHIYVIDNQIPLLEYSTILRGGGGVLDRNFG
jgi:hypothetical protein